MSTETLERNLVEVISLEPIPHAKIKANVSIKIAGGIVIHKVRIIDGKNGFWVALPKGEAPAYDPIVEIHDAKMKRLIDETVLSYWSRANNTDTIAMLCALASAGTPAPKRKVGRQEMTVPKKPDTRPYRDWQMPDDDISDVLP